MTESSTPLFRRIDIVILAIVFAVGIFLRLPQPAFSDGPMHALASLHPKPQMNGIGFDEGLYRGYLTALIKDGLGSYPDMVDEYVRVQAQRPSALLPPVRFLYIFTAYLWHGVFANGSAHFS